MEPIQQVAGVIIPPDGYLQRLRKMCDDHDILLVDNEVATGFGRTGKMFGIEHSGVDPDVMFLGKGFANGISMAGVMARKEIMEKEAEFPVVRGGSRARKFVPFVRVFPVSPSAACHTAPSLEDHRISRPPS